MPADIAATVHAAVAPVASDLERLALTMRADVERVRSRLDHVAGLLRSLAGNDPAALWLALVPPAGHA